MKKNNEWIWLSFSLPKAEGGFLGGCVVKADNVAEGIEEAWRLGINPGGSVLAAPIMVTPPEKWRNRLLSREDVDAMTAEMAETN